MSLKQKPAMNPRKAAQLWARVVRPSARCGRTQQGFVGLEQHEGIG